MENLEARLALSAPELPGNVGEVIVSQYEPSRFTTAVGLQASDLALGGPLKIDLTDPSTRSVSANTPSGIDPIINSGLIGFSQFNGGGFSTVGMQLKQSRLGRGLTIRGFDTPEIKSESTSAVGDESRQASPNTNLILNSQFNDGGFGSRGNRGRIGFQWRKVRVRGPVHVGLEDIVYQPAGPGGVESALPPVADTLAPGDSDRRDAITNTGRIRHSQFNDGGFGDLGFQWSNVAVGGRVATSTNTLDIRPRQNQLGPLTFSDLVFGQDLASGKSVAQAFANATETSDRKSSALSDGSKTRTALENSVSIVNDATNSGRIAGAQFNDGGFGDIGLQWRRVKVRNGVNAVHNSLSVEPENSGQGVITVENLEFPATPSLTTPSPKQALRMLSPTPRVVRRDGQLLGRKLPTPTNPLDPFFDPELTASRDQVPFVDAATNSGVIRAGQFNAGGFGDLGLQWLNVRVGESVDLVHNSLSVRSRGSDLLGVNVSNVSFGLPIAPRASRELSVLPTLVISPASSGGSVRVSAERADDDNGKANDRWLRNQQVVNPDGTDVFLQWNGVVTPRGLVLIQNVIKIHDLGPDSGDLTLEDIRFPGRVPRLSLGEGTETSTPPAAARALAVAPIIRDSSNNSGILSHNQFSDGGFGDLGLQWRNVQVAGRVAVVHNTLSVDLSADSQEDSTVGGKTGPISISNITFNSGALDQVPGVPSAQRIISPPPQHSRLSIHRPNRGSSLPHDPRVMNDATNSGIMTGGQFSAGGLGFGFLQWRGVKIPGKVTIIQNVLSIKLGDKPTGPVRISDVTFR
ncbi:hypothetical protein V5E97_12335 [Singulisphaera sp. Ch08]|uniref:Uncharacterized protein n=1 Tax=Singulisphaera sp. Ch08 TaxID=3120278 RepID=A0AAU7CNS1_9BACT